MLPLSAHLDQQTIQTGVIEPSSREDFSSQGSQLLDPLLIAERLLIGIEHQAVLLRCCEVVLGTEVSRLPTTGSTPEPVFQVTEVSHV